MIRIDDSFFIQPSALNWITIQNTKLGTPMTNMGSFDIRLITFRKNTMPADTRASMLHTFEGFPCAPVLLPGSFPLFAFLVTLAMPVSARVPSLLMTPRHSFPSKGSAASIKYDPHSGQNLGFCSWTLPQTLHLYSTDPLLSQCCLLLYICMSKCANHLTVFSRYLIIYILEL